MNKIGEWYTSSVCPTGTGCVAIKHLADGTTQVRDDKDSEGSTFSFTGDEWKAFLRGVRNDEMDHPTA